MTTQHDTRVKPLVVSIVSGKGGVGKTSFALALAHELSAAGNSVLLLDADLYNRGLLGLMKDYERRERCSSAVLDALVSEPADTDRSCSLIWIHDNLKALDIPPLASGELSSLESQTVDQMKSRLENLIAETVRRVKFDVIVIDCHGGRDVLSFASASVSDHVIVVSVPEINTFFGTLNLLKDLEQEGIVSDGKNAERANAPKFHMVFNMAQRGFRRRMLSHWYRRFFSRYFIDDDYLSVIAFDIRVSIATARRPFPTRRLHYSSMAEKVRCIVSDVFANDERVKIAREAIWVQRVMGPFIRARRPVLFVLINDRVALQAFMIGLGLLFGAVVALAALFGESWALEAKLNDVLLGMAVAQAVVSGMLFWTVFTFVAHSMIDHDTVVSGELTGADRMNWERIAIGVGGILLGLLVYTVFESAAHTIRGVTFISVSGISSSDMSNIVGHSILVIARVTLAVFVLVFVWRSVRNAYFRPFSGETIYRLIVLTTMGGLIAWELA